MILEKISARGVKGRTFEVVLGKGGTLIVGPNFEGKSAIVEAIRFLCSGKFAEVKKGSWPESEVSGQFDKGVLVRKINAKGTVSTSDELLAAALDTPLLNPELYPGLTDTQRTDYVFDRIRLPDSYSSHAIIAEIERISLGEKHSEFVEKAKRGLVAELHEFFVGDAPIQDALNKSVESLRDKFTYWNRRAKETQGAVATLTELKVRETNVKAAPANLGADIVQAQKDLAAINQEIGKLTAERDAAERSAGRRRQLQQALDADRIDYPRMLKKKQEEKEALEAGLVPEPKLEEIEEARRTIARATKDIQLADGNVEIADKAISEVDDRLKEIAHLAACPYCKAKGTGWKKTLEGELNKRKADSERAITVATKLRNMANDTIRDANETLETLLRAQESNHRLREQIRQLEREIGNLQTDQRTDSERRQRYQDEIKELKGGDVGKLNQSIAFAEEKRKGASSRLAELEETKTAETRLRQDLLRATESEHEHQEAEANKLLIKTVADFLKQKREAIICEAFTKLLQVANMVVKSILKSPLVLFENTIGRFEGSKFIEHYWFSGTEKALTYIAIATALSIDAQLKLVLLDEFGRLDADNQMHMINRLLHLVNEGVINQFVVVSTEIPRQVTLNEGSTALKLIEVGK